MNPLIFAVIVSKLAQMWMKTLIFVLTVVGGLIIGGWKFALKDSKEMNRHWLVPILWVGIVSTPLWIIMSFTSYTSIMHGFAYVAVGTFGLWLGLLLVDMLKDVYKWFSWKVYVLTHQKELKEQEARLRAPVVKSV